MNTSFIFTYFILEQLGSGLVKLRVRVRVRVMSQLISTTQHITHKMICQWVRVRVIQNDE